MKMPHFLFGYSSPVGAGLVENDRLITCAQPDDPECSVRTNVRLVSSLTVARAVPVLRRDLEAGMWCIHSAVVSLSRFEVLVVLDHSAVVVLDLIECGFDQLER